MMRTMLIGVAAMLVMACGCATRTRVQPTMTVGMDYNEVGMQVTTNDGTTARSCFQFTLAVQPACVTAPVREMLRKKPAAPVQPDNAQPE
jgi:hypothetical protein